MQCKQRAARLSSKLIVWLASTSCVVINIVQVLIIEYYFPRVVSLPDVKRKI